MRNVDLVGALSTAGAVAVGVALIETALLPGLAIGAAAVLVPRLFGGRRRTPQAEATRPRSSIRDFLPRTMDDLVHVRMSRAVVKTITFRVIVTSLDFTGNYLV